MSRATVREALQSLENEGVVRRVHGSGTFVNQVQSRVTGALDVDLGVTEAVQAANQRLGLQVLRVEETAAPREIAEQLALPPAGRILLIERSSSPTTGPPRWPWMPSPHASRTPPARPTGTGRCTAISSVTAAWCCSGGVAHVTAVDADSRMARLLKVDAGDALLRMEQVERSEAGDLVLYSLEHYVPSCFDLTVRRTRHVGAAR